jgi:hypothetical protein
MSNQFKKLRPTIGLEALEQRTPMSGWTTVDDYRYIGSPGTGPYSPGGGAQALAVDSGGQIYAGGYGRDTDNFHLLVKRSSDGGTSWSAPLDDHQAGFAQMSDMAVSSTGALFTAGLEGTLTNHQLNDHWLVRRSVDGGTTWSTVDQFSLGGAQAGASGIASDAAGNLYAVGFACPAGTTAGNWVVRRSQDGGTTWSTVDSFAADGGANGVFVHPTAGIFVAGTTRTGGKKGDINRWVIRRSTNGGTTWTNVDAYQLDQKYESAAHSLGIDAAGNLYAIGSGGSAAGFGITSGHWVVRKSANGGASWATVDNFQLQGSDTTAADFANDSSGNLYVVGTARLNYSNHWLVRRNPGGTGAWSTVDDFQPTTGQNQGAGASAVVADSFGNIFVAGGDTAADGTGHWVVRRLSNAGTSTFSAAPISIVTKWSLFHADDLQLDELIV